MPERQGRPGARDPYALALAFVALSALLFSRRYDGSGFTYAVVAELDGHKAQQLLHPLYVPLLRAIRGAARLLGWRGPLLEAFQWASLLAAATALALYARLGLRLGLDRVSAAAAAALFAGSSGAWYFAMQSKPYAAAVLALVAFLTFYREPGLRARARAAGMAAAVALATGFTLMAAAVAPLAAWEAAGPRRRRLLLPAAALAAAAAAALGGRVAALAPGSSLLDGRTLAQQLASVAHRLKAMELELGVLGALLLAAALAPRPLRRLRENGPALARAALVTAALGAAFVVAMNDFFYSVLLAAPLGAACALRGWAPGRWLLAAGAAVTLAHSLAGTVLPASRGGEELFRIEGDFLSRVTRPGDVILGGGPSDWRLLYFYRGLPLHELDFGGETGPLRARPVPAGEPALAFVDAALGRGARVLLAADNFFMHGQSSNARNEARRRELERLLLGRFRLGPPLVSPAAQHYYPLLRR